MYNGMFRLVSSYRNRIITAYKAIVKINESLPRLRLIDEKYNNNTSEKSVRIQVVGKNVFPVLHRKDIEDPFVFSSFSKEDRTKILNFFHRESNIFKRITDRTYNAETKEFAYTIEHITLNHEVARCTIVEDLSTLLPDLGEFDNEDAALILSASNSSMH